MINRFWMGLLLCVCSLSPSAYGADFNFSYEARKGDLDGDGRQDIYLRHAPAVVPVALDDLTIPVPLSKREIGEFVLQQNSVGSFSAVPLTSQQLALVRAWPLLDITLVVGDFNVDGNRDLILTSVATAISGAKDTAIFSPSIIGQLPIATRPFDSSVIQFAVDVDGRTRDPGYFQSGFVLSRTYTTTESIPAYLCSDGRIFGDTSVLAGPIDPVVGSPASNASIPANCSTYLGYRTFSGITVNEYSFDESRFNARALEFLDILAPYIDRNDGFTIPAATANAARDVVSQVFGGVSFRDNTQSPNDVVVEPNQKQAERPWNGYWRLLRRASRACLPCVLFDIFDPTDLGSDDTFDYFIHYTERKNEFGIRMSGLWPGAFATDESVMDGRTAQQRYGIPPKDALDTPPDSYFGIFAPPSLPVIFNGIHGAAVFLNPVTGVRTPRTGGGREFICPAGVPFTFLSGPFPLPPP